MKAIAIIENYPIIRVGLGVFINENFTEVPVFQSKNLDDFINDYTGVYPDLFIVGQGRDFHVDHVALIKKLKNNFKKSKVIIYDSHPDFYKVSLYLKSGFSGYVSKESEIPELLKCINEVTENRSYISNEILEVILRQEILIDSQIVANNKSHFSKLELEVMELLLGGNDVAFIAERLNNRLSIIRKIKKTVFSKLGIIEFARYNGNISKL